MQPSSTPDPHYDPASTPEQPRWDLVDIRFMYKFAAPLSLDLLRGQPGLKGMELLRKGSRDCRSSQCGRLNGIRLFGLDGVEPTKRTLAVYVEGTKWTSEAEGA